MSFWKKIKSLGNMITGGAATVKIEVENPCFGKPFLVKITAIVKDSDLKINRVYLKIRAQENVVVPDVIIANTTGESAHGYYGDVSRTHISYQTEVTVSGSQQLKSGETYEWEGSISLPDTLQPSYYGYYASHEWAFLAGLDCTGNDPDSGWVRVDIY